MGINYRWGVAKHPANVLFVGAGLAAGALFGWPVLAVAGALEALVLLTVPQYDSVRGAFDKDAKAEGLVQQRWYYLKNLWGIVPRTTGNPFLKHEMRWSTVLQGIRGSQALRGHESAGTFQRLCEIVEGLRGLRAIRPDAITDDQLFRLDEMINGWLTLLYTAKRIEDTLSRMDRYALADELASLEEMQADADPNDRATRVVMGERLRALQAKADMIPELEKRQGLVLAQADTFVQQVETLNAQIGASGVANASSLLNTTTVDALVNGYDEVTAAAEVRGMLSNTDPDDPQVWANLRKTVGATDTPRRRGERI